jgi:MFS family permease
MRNVLVLAIAQALSSFGNVTLALLGGILGAQMAPTPVLATLPATAAVVGLATGSVPAALIMRRLGRRPGFIGSAMLAAIAALLAALGIQIQSFALLCVAAFLLGCNWAFAQQYRFAAAESVAPQKISQAVSWVMIGTLAAAYLAPLVAVVAKDLVGREYVGSFVCLALVLISSGVVLFGLRLPEQPVQGTDSVTPLGAFFQRPRFAIAVLAGVVAFGVMNLVMTATPISMHVMDGHSLEATAKVIQSHVIAMYLPSLISGWLIARFGISLMMCAGVLAFGISAVSGLMGHELHHYWWSLVALGLGWNLLFVSGTTLLTQSYSPQERFRAQAINEFVMFGIMATASLAAGALLHFASWEAVNQMVLPVLAVMLTAALMLPTGRKRAEES